MKNKIVVGVVVKPSHPSAFQLTKDLIFWLTQRDYDYRIDSEVAKEHVKLQVPQDKIILREFITKSCDPIVVLGGDGTLISVSRHPASSSPTIIGVNLGTLGFLTEITIDELFPTLEAVLLGKAKLDRRLLLKGVVTRDNNKIAEYAAINDIVVTKDALARIFAVDLAVDSEFAANIRGDGLIVSTPGGSTAYSLAAGGSIVHPAVDALLVTPICAHSLTIRPLVLPGSSIISLKIASKAFGTNDKVFLTIDGQEGMDLMGNDNIEIQVSKHSVFIAKSPHRSYFEVLGTKLKWACN